jgi:hypothetical protein
MEKQVVEALQKSNQVTKNFMDFLKIKRINPNDIFYSNNAADKTMVFIEFFTQVYKVDFLFTPYRFEIKKSNTTVVSVYAEADNETLFVLLLVLLINYCENPF